MNWLLLIIGMVVFTIGLVLFIKNGDIDEKLKLRNDIFKSLLSSIVLSLILGILTGWALNYFHILISLSAIVFFYEALKNILSVIYVTFKKED